MAANEEATTEETTLAKLKERHGYWDEHITWSSDDWKTEVENGDTRHGYWEWVANQIEIHGADGSGEN